MRIMNFRNWVKNINESVKDDELDRILDKISNGKKLNNIEQKFLDTYNKFSEEHYQDSLCITKNDVYNKIRDLLEEGDKVICNLYDRNGVIGLPIVSIHNDFDEDFCYVVVTDGEKIKIEDKYLYNIIYNMKKDEYSLETEEEFFEKIPVKNEN